MFILIILFFLGYVIGLCLSLLLKNQSFIVRYTFFILFNAYVITLHIFALSQIPEQAKLLNMLFCIFTSAFLVSWFMVEITRDNKRGRA